MKKKSRIKIRRSWKIKPVTKVKTSAKIYKRRAAKRELLKEVAGEI